MRVDLWDALKHCWYTESDERDRKTVVRIRDYLMQLTLHPDKKNELPIDRSPADDESDRLKKFVTPRV